MLSELCVFSKYNMASIMRNVPIAVKYEPFVLPCSPASRHSCGIVPRMNPMNTHVIKGAFFSRSIPASPERPTKPIPAPSINIPSISQYFFRPFTGLDSVSISGLYMPKAAHKVPPLTPGKIAPKPTAVPSTSQSSQRSKLFFLDLIMTSPFLIVYGNKLFVPLLL